MRPLFHPSIDDVRLEAILHALSDPVRVQIFSQIAGNDCALTCSAFSSVNQRVIPKSSLSQHFKILRDAGLIRSERQGVEMRNTSRCVEVQDRFPGLLPAILEAHTLEAKRAKAS
jgi:DNA-binding transcriptional ArsR family regulator